MPKHLLHALFLIAACALSTGARAHIGTDFGAHPEIDFTDGLLHSLTGLDHLAALLAVGFWSALTIRRQWTAPLAFATMLLAGALVGLAGMLLATVVLHATGLGLGRAFRHTAWVPRVAGAGVAALGVTLLTQLA